MVKPVTVIGLAVPTSELTKLPVAVPANVTVSPAIGLIDPEPPRVAVVLPS